MDIRQIQYFVCLYEEGNVTRAAGRLHVVQSALSAQLARLEAEVGQKLFERSPQGMVPTPAGHAMFRLFLPILRDIATAKEEMARLGGEVTGELRVGLLESVAHSVLSTALADYAERYPGVAVRVSVGYSSTFIDQVSAGQLDLAVINRPRHRLALNASPILDEAMVVVSAGGNDLGPQSELSLRELGAFPLIVPSKAHGLREVLDRHASAHGIELAPRLEVDALAAIVELVASGRWIAIVPLITAHRGLSTGALRAYRLTQPPVSRSLMWIHHPRRLLTAAAGKFMEILGQHLTQTAAAATALSRPQGPG